MPDLPSLLSNAQESAVWERVIVESGADLFDIQATARLARDAFRLVTQWRIPFSDERWSGHEDGMQFQRWTDAFRRICRQNGWMTSNDVLTSLPSWTEAALLGTPSVISNKVLTPYSIPLLRCAMSTGEVHSRTSKLLSI